MTSTLQTEHRGFATPGSAYYPMLVAVFTGLVLISNVAATKGIAFGPIVGEWSLITDGGFIVFPLTYIIGDVLSEVYGFKATRRAIVHRLRDGGGRGVHVLAHGILPPLEFSTNQAHSNCGEPVHALIIAGLAGFIVGQTINAWVVVRIKERTKEKHLWARLIGSTVVGEFADTVVFCSIAAGAIGISTWRRLRHLRGAGLGVQNRGRGPRAAHHLSSDRVDQAPRADVSARRLRLR